jgi:hypothetical protein
MNRAMCADSAAALAVGDNRFAPIDCALVIWLCRCLKEGL